MIYESNTLQHYGIKGQRWGQRRFQNQDGTLTAEGKARYGVNKVGDSLRKTRDNSVKRGPKPDNKKPGFSLPKRNKNVLDKLDNFRDNAIKKGGPAKGLKTSGRHEKAVRDLDEVLDSKDPKVRNAYTDKDRKDLLDYRNKLAAKDNLPLRAKGLKTNGVYDREDGTKDTDRLKKDAKKDAEDMARAKAYYGEGAGNRRKQIRNRISERMKDPDYKAEYEKQLAAQDMSKHQKAANRERKVEDAKNSAKKVGRGLKNLLLGFGSASLTAVAIYNAAKLTGADKKIAEYGKKAIKSIISKAKGMKKPSVKDYNWHNNSGINTIPIDTVPIDTIPKSSYKFNMSDFYEKNDRSKRRPWIDDQGNIHVR